MTILHILLAWFIISIPAGMFIGRCISFGMGDPLREEARRQAP